MQDVNFEKIEDDLLAFTTMQVDKFLVEHSGKTFYAFAFDCNAEYGEVNLCLNTEEDFVRTLYHYQQGEFGHLYRSDDEIQDLKFNTGDWEHQCFATIQVLTENELTEIFDKLPQDDYKSWKEFINKLLIHFGKALLRFRQTEQFDRIPKTVNFRSFCIDHDEDIEDAERRLEKLF